MRYILLLLTITFFSGCAQKEFDQRAYDRQNSAAQKSLDTLE